MPLHLMPLVAVRRQWGQRIFSFSVVFGWLSVEELFCWVGDSDVINLYCFSQITRDLDYCKGWGVESWVSQV